MTTVEELERAEGELNRLRTRLRDAESERDELARRLDQAHATRLEPHAGLPSFKVGFVVAFAGTLIATSVLGMLWPGGGL